MECIVCNRELTDATAVCDDCAAGQLQDEWYVDGRTSEGTRRLLGMTDVVAILDGNGYTLTLDGLKSSEMFESLPEDVTGYASACALFNEIMRDLGQPLADSPFAPPPFTFVKNAIRRLEAFEERMPGKGTEETYMRLSLLYAKAEQHFRLPYVGERFIQTRREHLLERSKFWTDRIVKEQPQKESVSDEQQVDAVAIHESEATAETADSGEAVQESVTEVVVQPEVEKKAEEEPIEPKVELLKRRIESIEEVMKSSAAEKQEKAETAAREGGQPRFVRNSRKRAYLHYLAYSFDTALREIMHIIDSGAGIEHDYALASVLALRTGKYSVLDALEESAKTRSIGFDSTMLRAVADWKEGRWGRSLQLAEREMKKGNHSAGFLLKKSISEQYSLREKYDELKKEGKAVTDMQNGVDLLSTIYLSIGTWGAALQIMGNTNQDEWSAETWTSRGMAFEEKGDLNGAQECYEKALEINDKLLPAIVREGLLQCKLGKHETALEMLKRAGQLEPPILRLQAAEMVELGRKEEALELLERLLRQDDDDAEAASLGLRLSRELGLGDKERIFRLYVHRREGENGGQE